MTKLTKSKISYFFLLFLLISSVKAVSVEDNKGVFKINYTPKKVVVLELSFVDSLALVDMVPIGIADENDKNRLFPKLKEKIGEYTSVGLRSQPNLEIIASLKPDLIIADIRRHESVYESLKKIAPTLILPSKRSSYLKSFEINKKIGKVLGKEKQMNERLKRHKNYMEKMAKKLPKKFEIQVSTAREDAFFLNTDDSYIAEVIKSLGFKYPKSSKNNDAPRYASLEQLLSLNPEYLIVGEQSQISIIDTWKKKPLWKMLKCSKEGHIIRVDRNLWSRSRGIMATEQIAEELISKFGNN